MILKEYLILRNIFKLTTNVNIISKRPMLKEMSTSRPPITVGVTPPELIGNVVAIGQMQATDVKSDNLLHVQKIVETAKEKLAKIVFLPECCDFVGNNRKQTLELAEPIAGKTIDEYKSLAKKNDIWISLGGVHESILNDNKEKTDKIFNTHLVINNLGDIVSIYRKLHLFDVDTEEFKFRESDVVTSGLNIIDPISTPVGSVGLQICYDIRFPEVSTILRKRGAEILTYPSAFAFNTGEAHWEILLRARAIENQCYVIAPAQIGYHNKKRRSYGHAMVVDPWGKILANCHENNLDVQVAVIDLEKLKKIRNNMPCFHHRKDKIYSLFPLKLESFNSDSVEDNELKKIDFKFADHTIPFDTIFYQTKCSVAFTNIRCVVPGHILVATKRHANRLKDMSVAEIGDFFQTVCKIQKVLEEFYGATSSTVTVQDGEHAGQTVRHVHCHIMPRKEGDFKHNDEIYIQLNRHDSCDKDLEKRSLTERIDEAEQYRKLF